LQQANGQHDAGNSQREDREIIQDAAAADGDPQVNEGDEQAQECGDRE